MERIRNEYISRTAHAERGQTEIMCTCPKDAEFGTARHEAKTGGSPQRGLIGCSDMKLVSFRMQNAKMDSLNFSVFWLILIIVSECMSNYVQHSE